MRVTRPALQACLGRAAAHPAAARTGTAGTRARRRRRPRRRRGRRRSGSWHCRGHDAGLAGYQNQKLDLRTAQAVQSRAPLLWAHGGSLAQRSCCSTRALRCIARAASPLRRAGRRAHSGSRQPFGAVFARPHAFFSMSRCSLASGVCEAPISGFSHASHPRRLASAIGSSALPLAGLCARLPGNYASD